MKKIAFLILTLCLTLAGCKKDGWTPVLVGGAESTEWTVSPSVESESLPVTGGSGDYSAAISDPAIAEVSVRVEPLYGDGLRLVVEPKQPGEATITVTDNRSGLTATCVLTVKLTIE